MKFRGEVMYSSAPFTCTAVVEECDSAIECKLLSELE